MKPWRAYQHFIPGYAWHITHRCHRWEFLFKFAKDRTRWMELLFEAKRRDNLSILNFIVTSNNIGLVVASPKKRESVPQTMQLVAGRAAQKYIITGERAARELSGRIVIMPRPSKPGIIFGAAWYTWV